MVTKLSSNLQSSFGTRNSQWNFFVIKRVHLIWIAAIVAILDQVTKYIVLQTKPAIQLLPFLSFNYVENFGAGFGILQNQRILLLIISIIVLAVIIYAYKKVSKPATIIATGLIAGGTLGNLIDRAFLGFVVDFITFPNFPSFNIADSALTIGVVILIIAGWKEEAITKTKKKKSKN